jgi:hypothetical protein
MVLRSVPGLDHGRPEYLIRVAFTLGTRAQFKYYPRSADPGCATLTLPVFQPSFGKE